MPRLLLASLLVALVLPAIAHAGPVVLRVAVFNLWDVRSEDLRDPSHLRVRALAEIIQRVRPNVLVLNEIAYDIPGMPGVPDDAEPGQNARLFVDNFLSVSQAPGLEPLSYISFMPEVNTGMPSGFDLDRSGAIVTTLPEIPAGSDYLPGRQTDEGRAFGGDAFGFGTFPGQYGMALLVDRRLGFDPARVRTFRLFPWLGMPNAKLPVLPDGTPWYEGEAREAMRLSSKSHVDAPIDLANGATLHVLMAHPTPPVFDGEENRNGLRNHDEIRLLADYIAGATYLSDDAGRIGPLPRGGRFVIMGDLNADPDKPNDGLDPVGDLLLSSHRVGRFEPPRADLEVDGLGPSDTAVWGKRVDHIIPSAGLAISRSGVWRTPPANWTHREPEFPSDHYLVWADLVIPASESRAREGAKP